MPTLYGTSEDIEIRAGGVAGGVAEIAVDFGGAVVEIINAIKNGKAMDEQTRGKFTQSVVDKLSAKDPSFNYVVCHTEHKTAFDGAEGKDWGHSHQEVDVQIGGTIGFEIYHLKSGKFTRVGDGGYLNWAYKGKFKASSDGKELTFSAP
ncbi:hypothetical protein BDZ94DRAFT_1312867 [Collybia nuda]|uniref:Uncharacterized protein n=1 Tax=Collybia nuda TaxID=64659 RepID=A0A9P5Y066_9AGAR|nr:hypothetical protein BDZ94DRAFT_1312867 [Collybia nuda]